MDLWIRSQDKRRLIPNPNLYVVYSKENNCAYIGDTLVGYIARYDTEERALEVLSEIQMFKDFFQYAELLPNNKKWEWLQKIDFKQGDSLTYEMPKE